MHAFGFTYEGSSCTGSSTGITCDCDPFDKTLVVGRPCNGDEHCIGRACVGDYEACASTGDGVTLGDCRSGALGDGCETNAHCQSGYCGQLTTCTEGATGDPCNSHNQCQSGQCYMDNTPKNLTCK